MSDCTHQCISATLHTFLPTQEEQRVFVNSFVICLPICASMCDDWPDFILLAVKAYCGRHDQGNSLSAIKIPYQLLLCLHL